MAAFHSTPIHDPEPEEFQRPARVCVCKSASVLSCLPSCCCWRRRPPAVRRSRLRVGVLGGGHPRGSRDGPALPLSGLRFSVFPLGHIKKSKQQHALSQGASGFWTLPCAEQRGTGASHLNGESKKKSNHKIHAKEIFTMRLRSSIRRSRARSKN